MTQTARDSHAKTMVARSLVDLLEVSASKYPDRDAFVYGDTRLSYGNFLNVVDRLAAGLGSLGLRRGDRMALMLPNLPQFPIAYFALLKLGVWVVPVNFMFKEFEIQALLADAQVKGFIAWEGFGKYLLAAARNLESCRLFVFLGKPAVDPREAAPAGNFVDLTKLIADSAPMAAKTSCEPEDPAVILYTMGTIGVPRGAVLTHNNLVASIQACWEAFSIDSGHRFAAALPLFHNLGQMLTMNLPLAAGACSILLPRFQPAEIIATIAREKVTHFAAVPTMLRLLLDGLASSGQQQPGAAPATDDSGATDLSSLQALLVSGAPLEPGLRESLTQRFGIPIYEGYGLTECAPLCTSNRPDIANKIGSVGRQMPGLEVTIFDERGYELPPGEVGEVVVRGAAVMAGYLNREDETKNVLRDGWLFTGDIGNMDTAGYLHLKDRKKDVVLKGGFPVFSQEVERCLLAHPKVRECAVVGVPDRVLGEEVKAYVVVQPSQFVPKEELLEFCNARLAAYKCPRHIEFYQELPHGPTGKILKRLLREKNTNT